ncbi:MAG: hypothetical protein U0V02_10845 [Anaerolineales bacterium]
MKFIKRLSLFEVVLVAVILSIHLYAAFSDAYNFPNAWFKRDDAYYYFKVAQNITEGHGSTFDGINLSNGYHPLWMIVCIPIFALARFDLILPLRILLMVMAIFQSASAVLIYRLVKNHLSEAVAIAAASFWAFNLYIHSTVYEYGLETPLAIFTILYLVYRLSIFETEWRTDAVTKRQLVEIALLAVLVMFSRLDLIFLAVIVGVWVVFRGKLIRYLLPLDVLIIFASMVTSAAYRTGITPYNTMYAAATVKVTVTALSIKIVALYFFGTYQHPRIASIWKIFLQTFLALTTSTVVISAVVLVLTRQSAEFNFPRSAILVDFALSFALIFIIRLTAYWFSTPKQTAAVESPLSELKANWTIWLTEGIGYYGVLGGFLLFYMLFNKFMFGTTSPVSGQIKRWWGTMPNTIYEEPPSNWYSFFGIGRSTFNAWDPATDLVTWLANLLRPYIRGADMVGERYYIAMLILAILGLVLLFANKRRAVAVSSKLAFLPLVVGSGIQILSYSATAYGGLKEWYWTSELVLITLVGSFYLDLILRPLLRIKYPRLAMQVTALVFGAFLAYHMYDFIAFAMPYGNERPTRRPLDVLLFLEANTQPGTVIGMTGGGNVGYFISERTIVNMDGLINSNDYFHALQNGEAPAYLHERGMSVIFANAQMMSVPPFFGQFSPYLERYNEYGGKGLFYLLEEPKY